MNFDSALAAAVVIGLVAVCVVGLLVVLIGFIAWIAIRKARPAEVTMVLAELQGIIQALHDYIPRFRLAGSNVSVGTQESVRAVEEGQPSLLRGQQVDDSTYEVFGGRE
ncbi:hypothetical protein [Kitasatospora cystarginea]|uniref:hypothetical protein n=1 Tax=Kitasatospora cystarginea TaxID=58350 RepID=UPI0031CEB15D